MSTVKNRTMCASDRWNRTLKSPQSVYAGTVLHLFSMTHSKTIATPMKPPRKNFSQDYPSKQPAGDVPYRSAIGCLIFLMVGTRTDTSDAVDKLSQHSEQPLVEHWVAVKRVLRYIAGTKDVGIVYGYSQNITLYGYTDSDWAGDTKTRKSTSGYAFIMAGGPVSWRSPCHHAKLNTSLLATRLRRPYGSSVCSTT